ncbi:MAG TPA: hypothetical protein VD793_10215 [Gemmatimonadales bacterium]|nr:hypothetical protein [Gemmatimonadales bacterium]
MVAWLASAALLPASLSGQARVSLDAGVSRVEYQGFLPSAAFSLAPALSFGGAHFGLAARAGWLRFESGNNSLRGSLAGSYTFSATGRVGGDLAAELGGSRYEAFNTFSHALGRGRLIVMSAGGLRTSLAATAGMVTAQGGRRPVAILGAAWNAARRDLVLTLGATGTVVGGVSYGDFETGLRYGRPGGLEADAILSVRAGDRTGQVGPFFEAALAAPVTRLVSLVLGGGRYAEDVVRGNVAGNYLTAGLRVARPVSPRRWVTPVVAGFPPPADGATVAAALVEIRRGRNDACTLVFRADATMEIMADFTDWLPLALQPAGPGVWTITLLIQPGRHRLNVRLVGGAWGVPGGVTPVPDDFLGVVGTVVIP